MSVSTTYDFTVYGDSYTEVLENAEVEISTFLGIDTDEINNRASYEMHIQQDFGMDAEFTFKANVIARLR